MHEHHEVQVRAAGVTGVAGQSDLLPDFDALPRLEVDARPGNRCAYEAMLPSSCRMRTWLERLQVFRSRSMPRLEIRGFPGTRPCRRARRARAFLPRPQGRSRSGNCARGASAPPGPCEGRAADSRGNGHAYTTRSSCCAFGSPITALCSKSTSPCTSDVRRSDARDFAAPSAAPWSCARGASISPVTSRLPPIPLPPSAAACRRLRSTKLTLPIVVALRGSWSRGERDRCRARCRALLVRRDDRLLGAHGFGQLRRHARSWSAPARRGFVADGE